VSVLGRSHSVRIDTLVRDIVDVSLASPEVAMSERVARALDVLRDFMFERVYLRQEAHEQQEKAIGVIRSLFAHYLDHPEEIPSEYRSAPDDLPTQVVDYIAGMTDRYALRIYERLFLPQGWML
jgi:dGTPase